MKERYDAPELEIFELSEEDVITTSGDLDNQLLGVDPLA